MLKILDEKIIAELMDIEEFDGKKVERKYKNLANPEV